MCEHLFWIRECNPTTKTLLSVPEKEGMNLLLYINIYLLIAYHMPVMLGTGEQSRYDIFLSIMEVRVNFLAFSDTGT